jgi:hypothetical protein
MQGTSGWGAIEGTVQGTLFRKIEWNCARRRALPAINIRNLRPFQVISLSSHEIRKLWLQVSTSHFTKETNS